MKIFSSRLKNNKLAMISSSLNRGGAERQVVSCLEGISNNKKFRATIDHDLKINPINNLFFNF